MTSCTSCKSKQKKIDLMIGNLELMNLDLNKQEKLYYTNLFYDHSTNERVTREKFPQLLGMFGTDIAENFAGRIFDTFSSDKKEISLFEYLKYVNVYHYGDERKRCEVTFDLMDFSQSKEISIKDFSMYINLIIGAVRKVAPGVEGDLLSEQDITNLFTKISQNKKTFVLSDFEKVYHEKSELVSWFDYFRNSKEDILYVIIQNMQSLLFTMKSFFHEISNKLKEVTTNHTSNEAYNLKPVVELIHKVSHNMEKQEKYFLDKMNPFNIRKIFEKLNKAHFDKTNTRKSKGPAGESRLMKSKTHVSPHTHSMENPIAIEEEVNVKNPFPMSTENKPGMINQVCSDIGSESVAPLFSHLAGISKFFTKVKSQLNNNFDIKEEENVDEHEEEMTPLTQEKQISEEQENSKNIISMDMNDIKIKILEKIPWDFDNNNKANANVNVNGPIKNNEKKKQEIKDIGIKTIQNENVQRFQSQNRLSEVASTPADEELKMFSSDSVRRSSWMGDKEKEKEKEKENENSIYNTQISNLNINDELLKVRGAGAYHMGPHRSRKDFSQEITNVMSMPQCPKKCRCEEIEKAYTEQIMTYNSNLENFFHSLGVLCGNFHKTIKYIEHSNRWITKKYLINQLKKIESEKKRQISRFSVLNIPKAPLRSKKRKFLIKAPDESFKLLLNMIMGIQIAVQATPNFEINANATEIQKYLNGLTYSIQTINYGPKKQEVFSLREYAGIIFNNIRKTFGIDKESFIASISPQDFITELMVSSSTIIEELCSTGKSGSLFFYTRDGKFILKTISKTEYHTLKKIIPNYFQHIRNNPNTLLPKFLGCYKLIKKVKKKKTKVHFIIMMNIFATDKKIKLRYDLKGSSIGRQVLKGNKSDNNVFQKNSFALMELDLEQVKEFFYVGDKKKAIMEQLDRDAEFLCQNTIIDYSLLIGIHRLDDEILKHQREKRVEMEMNTHIPKSNQRNINGSLELIPNGEAHSMRDIGSNQRLEDEYHLKENVSEHSALNIDKSFTEDSHSVQGASNGEEKHPFHDFDDGGILGRPEKEIFFIGLIDILTEFNCGKSCEYFLKMVFYCSQKMSCVPPRRYKERFISYMNSKILDKIPPGE